MTALKRTTPPAKANKAKMTVDEFMAWYETAEGRWELHDGVPVRKHDPAKGQAERFGHARVKNRIVRRLEEAVVAAKLDCEVLPDGMSVKIDDHITYEPDAQLYCGEHRGDEELFVPDPIIIVEVLSPSTAYKDIGDKLTDYFRLPSVAHYLVLDPAHKRLIHHYREDGHLAQRAVHGRELTLEPPGLTLALGDLFG